jgi:histidyl-tRNA synthetase
MRDFYPEDMLLRNAVFDAWRQAAEQHAFEHYDACIVESLDLLKRKGGEEIEEQIYFFKDKSDRDLALRAEMTPTLARMIAARQGALSFPLKWFTIAQCFRYERTTKGRKREHYQLNLDILGEPSVAAEAEVIAAAIRGASLLGLDANDLTVRISSRALLADLLAASGVEQEHHPASFLALDKRGKLPEEKIAELLADSGVPPASIDKVLAITAIQSLDDAISALGHETSACTELLAMFAALDAHGLSDWACFDISVVRGLGYYTGIVFEAFDTDREFRAIFGGGRYDNLLADIGGKPISGVGLGFGDVVISDLLAARNKLPDQSIGNCIAIGFLNVDQRETAIRIATGLREQGRNVDLAVAPQKAKGFFAKASARHYAQAIFIGPDDIASGTVKIKTLADRTEERAAIDSF